MATDTTQTDTPVEEAPEPTTAPGADPAPASPASDAPTEPTTGPDTPPVKDEPTLPQVVSQEGALVGDEAIAEALDPSSQVAVVNETTPAQVSPPRSAPADTVPVNETHVTTDVVVTDPSAPEASLVPDAGRSPLLTQGLPISALNGPTVEDYFREHAADVDESTASSLETGTSPNRSAS